MALILPPSEATEPYISPATFAATLSAATAAAVTIFIWSLWRRCFSMSSRARRSGCTNCPIHATPVYSVNALGTLPSHPVLCPPKKKVQNRRRE